MYIDIYNRTIKYAMYIIDNKATIRMTAKKFGVAKSSVHYDLKYRLPQFDKDLFDAVKEILIQNFNEKHIRGGLATRQKYLKEKQVKEMFSFDYYGC